MKKKFWILLASLYCIFMGIVYHDRFGLSIFFFAVSAASVLLTVISDRMFKKNSQSMEHHPELDDCLRQLIAAGKKIKAVKFYRKSTGVTLKEAHAYIEYLCSTL